MSECFPSISVVMRTKNSAWCVEQSLAALFSQTYRGFELLVVDSGSTDATLDMVRKYPAKLIHVEPGEYFPGAVLNRAVEQARGEWIVFQNSDVVPLHPQALERLIKPLRQPDVAATYARQVPRPEALQWVRRDYAVSFPNRPEAPPWITLSLPFAAVKRRVWQQHPFYTDAWASEDTEWGRWAMSHGHRIRYVHDCVVMHSHNYSLREIYGRRFVEGEADAFIFPAEIGNTKPPHLLRRVLSSIFHDIRWQRFGGEWQETPGNCLRRLVYHWAYRQGRIWGERRRRTGDANARVGQNIILSRHSR